MRGSRYGLLAAMAGAVMLSGAASNEIVIEAAPRRRKPRGADEAREQQRDAERAPEARAEPQPAAPRVLTEADNTRLREAAEKRFRKAQRQARGMVTAALGPSAKVNSGTNLKDQSQ